MKITDISLQVRNPNRVNVSIDGEYRLSLDIAQVTQLGIKIGSEFDDDDIAKLEDESEYGKLYTRALEYTITRPRSVKEVRDYLKRKTYEQRYKSRKTGEIESRPGVSQYVADRVLSMLIEKSYIDDESFSRWWVENRNQRKGSSLRKLKSELSSKGVASELVDAAVEYGNRSDDDEILKIIAKKRRRYTDDKAMMNYLARQGFSYQDIKTALHHEWNDS